MKAPEIPHNESQRQAAVERYGILDTLPEENYDNITALMAHIAGAPVSLITMLDKDRNFLKSHHGVPFSESPREISFCGHAINAQENITIIEDATRDIRFQDNPLVTDAGVKFYAGVPLTTPDKYRLGTLCIFDTKPRVLEDDVKLFLLNMAKQVETILEHRRQNQTLIDYRYQLEERNKELKKFAQMVTHDIKSPLVSTLYVAKSLAQDHAEDLSAEAAEAVERIVASSTSVNKYIDEMLDHYTSDKLLLQAAQTVNVSKLISEVADLTCTASDVELTISGFSEDRVIQTNKGALLQILVNLVTNGIKFTEKKPVVIKIEFFEESKIYQFKVSDKGVGIPKDRIAAVFDLFTQGDYNSISGSGLGLATAKKLVDRMEGEIAVESVIGEGTTFSLSIPKQPASDAHTGLVQSVPQEG